MWFPFSRPSCGLTWLLELLPSYLHSGQKKKKRRKRKGSGRRYLHTFIMLRRWLWSLTQHFSLNLLVRIYLHSYKQPQGGWKIKSLRGMAICLTKSWRFFTKKNKYNQYWETTDVLLQKEKHQVDTLDTGQHQPWSRISSYSGSSCSIGLQHCYKSEHVCSSWWQKQFP